MIKKTLLSSAAAMMLAGFFFGTDTVSYFTTSIDSIRDSVKGSVPLEFELERARNLVKDLAADVDQSMGTIAQEEVELDRLKKQIEETLQTQATERVSILRLQNELATEKTSFEFGGKTFTEAEVRTDLTNRFERFKTNEETLKSLNDIQTAREKGLTAAREKLQGMLAARRKAEIDIQNCEARLKMLEAAQTTSAVTIDDSRLSRTKNLISDVQRRLDVASKRLSASTEIVSEIPLDKPASENIEDQVADFFQLPDAPAQNVVAR
jgi:hypothetical protein